jgi:hypothetical protein
MRDEVQRLNNNDDREAWDVYWTVPEMPWPSKLAPEYARLLYLWLTAR